jgi:hypothetical protein
LLQFKCAVGSACGIWKGESSPEVGETYSVEIEIDRIIDDSFFVISGKHKLEIAGDENEVSLVGIIEFIDSDGMLFIRLDGDCLFMLSNERRLNYSFGSSIKFDIESKLFELWLHECEVSFISCFNRLYVKCALA